MALPGLTVLGCARSDVVRAYSAVMLPGDWQLMCLVRGWHVGLLEGVLPACKPQTEHSKWVQVLPMCLHSPHLFAGGVYASAFLIP